MNLDFLLVDILHWICHVHHTFTVMFAVFVPPSKMGHNALSQNFRAEVQKFLGVKWIATDPNGLVSFHSKRVLRSLKMKDVGSLLLILKLDDDFNGDINDIV